MTALWLLEKRTVNSPTIADQIQGAFAVRLVASAKSLRTLLALTHDDELPDAIVFNALQFELGHPFKAGIRGVPVVAVGGSGSDESSSTLSLDDRLVMNLMTRLRGARDGQAPYFLDFESLKLQLRDCDMEIALSYKEAKIIKTFLESPAKPISRNRLSASVWGGAKVSRSTVDSQISRLRKKLKDVPIEIESVYGGGYRLS